MKEDKEDKKLVVHFFKNKSIQARNYPKTEGKNPDFELYENERLFGICELKSITDYEFLGLRKDPTYNKIQDKIHKASKQFRSANSAHKSPNILFFINHCNKVGFQDLWFVLTGQATPPNKPSDPFDVRYLNRLLKKDDLSFVDFFIWADMFGNEISFLINFDSRYSKELIDSLSSKALERKNIKEFT
jgi:hypothetical protein